MSTRIQSGSENFKGLSPSPTPFGAHIIVQPQKPSFVNTKMNLWKESFAELQSALAGVKSCKIHEILATEKPTQFCWFPFEVLHLQENLKMKSSGRKSDENSIYLMVPSLYPSLASSLSFFVSQYLWSTITKGPFGQDGWRRPRWRWPMSCG